MGLSFVVSGLAGVLSACRLLAAPPQATRSHVRGARGLARARARRLAGLPGRCAGIAYQFGALVQRFGQRLDPAGDRRGGRGLPGVHQVAADGVSELAQLRGKLAERFGGPEHPRGALKCHAAQATQATGRRGRRQYGGPAHLGPPAEHVAHAQCQRSLHATFHEEPP